MTAVLVVEAARINKQLGQALRQSTVTGEAPLRLHSREIDSGGAPELHPAFLRWLDNRSVCTCGRAAVCAPGCRFDRDRALGHLSACEPACVKGDGHFRPSINKASPTRLKRALRQVRRLNPKAYDLVYLIVALGYAWHDATAKLNADHLSRGQMPRSEAEFGILWVSGASMLVAGF